MKRISSIRVRTAIYTIIPVIICFSIICSVLFISLFQSQSNSARAELQLLGSKYVSLFENKINSALNYLTITSNTLELQLRTGARDREMLQRMVWNAFDQYEYIYASNIYFEPNMYDGKDADYIDTNYGTKLSGRISYYYYRVDGQTRYLPEALKDDIEFTLPSYLEVKRLNTPVYTEPVMHNIDGADILMFTISFPIHDQNKEFIGAVSVDIYLRDMYMQLMAEKIYETGYILIANDKGQVIYSPRYEDIGRTREETGIIYSLPPDDETTVVFSSRSIINNKRTLVTIKTVYFPQLDNRFYISATAPLEEINAKGTRLLITIMAVCIAVVIFIAIFLFYLTGKLMQPVIAFKENAEKIGKGDFSVRITGNYIDEFDILKDTVNLMAERIEEHMEESKINLNILQTILNGIDAYIYVTIPRTGELLFINERMKKLFNLKGDEGIGQPCYKVFRQDFEARCPFCPCFELDKDPDKVIVWEDKILEFNRDIRHTDRYIDWPGGLKVHMQQAIDITDIKTITEEKLMAEKTSLMKSVFLASMSHEIRTPMHGIIGFSELALDDTIPPKTRNYLSKIKASAESLLLIINDILDVSKIEAGKIKLEKIPFNVSDVFKLCRLIASPNAQEKGLTLFCYAEPSVGKILLGDPTRLRQVLLNLLSNAIKFTNNGMIKLLAAIIETTENSVTMRFEVKDSGIGMTEEQINRIFQPFMQADDSTTRKYGGTGLGLTITKNFVELMGGKLEVESSFGLGSKFSFNLKFEIIDEKSISKAVDITVNSDEKPIFNGEVLVCEDNNLNQMVISDHLSKIGLKSVIAVNGRIAVDLVKNRTEKNNPFDLIFMDIHMPEMDGLEAAKKIIEMGVKTPIIALTANIMTNDREAYLESGMQDCLPKPFVANELWSCLLKYLKPVSMSSVKKISDYTEEDQQIELITIFVKSNQTTIKEIKDAINAGNIKLAHRLAHTLKSVAGIVKMTNLTDAAFIVEQSLSSGKLDSIEKYINRLEKELKTALDELTPLANKHTESFTENVNNSIDKEYAIKLLDELDLLLKADSFDCVNLVNDLRAIPGMEKLSYLVENLKFRQAREILVVIKQKMENNHV